MFLASSDFIIQKESISMSDPGVVHTPDRKVFSLETPGHEAAFLEYELDPDTGTMDMFETFVPESLRGRGVAKLLADAAFNWAVDTKMRMRLSCWYLAGYLERHPREDVQCLVIK